MGKINKPSSLYFNHMNQYLIKSPFIHSFLYILESINILTQFLEIFNNDFNNKNGKLDMNKSSIPLKLLKFLNMNQTLLFFIIISFLLIFDIFYLIYDIIQCRSKTIILIFINFYELLYFRFLFIFYITIIFSVNNYYFFVSLFTVLIHLIISINNFQYFHLYEFSPPFINLPYDCLSSKLDIYNSFVKIFISLSLNSNGKVSKFFYLISFISNISICLYLIILMITKSYYLMNNIFLSKIRLSMNFGISITLMVMFFHGTKRILSKSFILIIFLIFINSLISTIIYDPFNFIYIKKNNNDSNAIFYLFTYFSNLKNKIKFQQVLNYHIKKCKICDMCTQLNENNNEKKHLNIHKFFDKIYNGKNNYLRFLNHIMDNYLKYNLKYLSSNPNILMNILNLYYNNCSNNKNLKLNLQILFISLNAQNKTQIENQKILIKQLVLMNEFILTSKKIIDQLKKVINNSFSDSPFQFDDMINLAYILNELNSKEFKKYIFDKKKIIFENDSFYLLSICVIFYEEILGEHISNNQINIKDNFSQYEEIINYLYSNNNNITLLLDIIHFDIKIIRIGKDLNEYLNSSLFELFPENLERIQKKKLKKLILSLIDKNQNKTLDTLEYNIPEIKLIIINKTGDTIYPRLLILRINFLYKKDISEQIVLNGQYIIENDIIISLERNHLKNSILIGFGNSKFFNSLKGSKNKIPLTLFLSKNNIDEKFLKLILSIKQENGIYNIYKYKLEKKFIKRKNTIESNIQQSIIDKYKENESKVISLEHSSNSHTNNFSKKNKNNLYNSSLSNNIFHVFQAIEISLLILIIIILIIEFIHKQKLRKKFNKHYTMMTDFRTFYRKIYHTIASFLVVMCIAESPNKTTCVNYMEVYSNRYNSYFPGHFLNFTKLLQEENILLAISLGDSLNTFETSLGIINDRIVNKILYDNFTFIQVVPNLNVKKINIIQNNINLEQALELLVNSFIIINSYNDEYMIKPFFIINYKNNIFDNLNYDAEFSEVQIHIYQIILNFYGYEKKLRMIRYRLDDYYNILLKQFKIISIIYHLVLLFIKIIIILILYLNVSKFNSILLMILNSIRIQLYNREEFVNFKNAFDAKIINLEKLIQIYSSNPVLILEKLEDIYHKFKTNLNQHLRKQNNRKKENLEDEYKNLLKQIETKYIFSFKTLKKSGYNSIYFIFMIILIFIIIVIFLIENGVLLNSFNIVISVINIIKVSASTEASGYKNIIYYQFLLYLNQTEKEISNLVDYKSIDSDIQDKFIEIFKTEQNQKKVSNILVFLSEVVSLDCKDFFDLANDERLNKINNKFPEMKLYENLSFYCTTTYAMKEHKSEVVFQNLFGLIMDGIKSIGKKDYNSIIQYLEKDYLYKCLLFNFFIYRPLRSIVNYKVIKIGTKNIMDLFASLCYITFLMDLISEIIIISIIIFVFIIKIQNNYQNIVRLKKIFHI